MQCRATLLIALAGLGCDAVLSSAGGPGPIRAPTAADAKPQLALLDVAPASLCVTKGELSGSRVEGPTFRATALGHDGNAASLKFVLRGEPAKKRALASGFERRQLGLKLRAQNGCNLVYVIWRLDPKPWLEVAIKRNPGARTHRDCGARGYTRLEPTRRVGLPALEEGTAHELRAEISGDALIAWIDDRVVWRGELPSEARELSGPAGVRSDNLVFELAGLAVDAQAGGELDIDIKCREHDSD